MTYKIIATGSKGNAVLVNGKYLFDCGVSFSKIRPYIRDLRAVFLTHEHSDHFNPRTIRKIHQVRPMVKFMACPNLFSKLAEAGVEPFAVVPLTVQSIQPYPMFDMSILPLPLIHDVENVGYWVSICEGESREDVLYATDTQSIPFAAPWLDLYLIEANYTTAELEARRAAKQARGEFTYEDRAQACHMSYETATAWVEQNRGPKSEVVFLHQHQ